MSSCVYAFAMHSSKNKNTKSYSNSNRKVAGSSTADNKHAETVASLKDMFPGVETATLYSLIEENGDLDSIVAELLQQQEDQSLNRYQMNDSHMEAVLHGVLTNSAAVSAPKKPAVSSWEHREGQSSSSYLTMHPKQAVKKAKPYCPSGIKKEKLGQSPCLKLPLVSLESSSESTQQLRCSTSALKENVSAKAVDSEVEHLKSKKFADNHQAVNDFLACDLQNLKSILSSGEPKSLNVAGGLPAPTVGGADSGHALSIADDSSEDTVLRMLMEMFLPKLTINDIAREYANADGDANLAAAKLMTLFSERASAERVPNVAVNHSALCTHGQPQTGNTHGLQQVLVAQEEFTSHHAIEAGTGDVVGRCEEQHASPLPRQFAVPRLGTPPKTKMEQELPLAFSHLHIKENTVPPSTDASYLASQPISGTKEAEDFLFSMVCEEHGVERSTINDILGFFGGDTEKSLDALMDIIKASQYPDDDGTSVASSSEDVSPVSVPEDDPAVKALLELCPQVDRPSAKAVLVAHDGDVQAAANNLLHAENDAAAVRSQKRGGERSLNEQTAMSFLRQKFPSVAFDILEDVLEAAKGNASMASEHLQSAGYHPWHPTQSQASSSPSQPCLRSIMTAETLSQSPAPKATPTRPHGAQASRSRSPGGTNSAWGEPKVLFPEPTFFNGAAPPSPAKSALTSHEPPPNLFSSEAAAASRDPAAAYTRKWEREWVGEQQQELSGWRKARGRTFGSEAEQSEFDRENRESQEHFRLAKYYFQEANKEFGRGNKTAAYALVAQGRELNNKAKEERAISSSNLLAKRSVEHNNSLKLDLHQQYVEEALKQLELHILVCPTLGTIQTLIVITGYGRHSEKGVAKIKPAVLDYLRARNINWTEMNPGCVSIEVEDIVKATRQVPH